MTALCVGSLYSDDPSTKPNTIILIGEDHYDPEHIKVKEDFFGLARANEIILVLENRGFGEIEPNVFGIEDISVHSFTIALEDYSNLMMYKIMTTCPISISTIEAIKVYKQKKFVEDFSPPEMIFKVMISIIGTVALDLFKKHPDILQKFYVLNKLQNTVPEKYKSKLLELVQGHSYEKPFFLKVHNNIIHWLALYKEMAGHFLRQVEEDRRISFEKISEWRGYIEGIEKYEKMSAEELSRVMKGAEDTTEFPFENYTYEISVDIRNQIFIDNIASLFEQYNLKEKPFYVIVGLSHIPFLYTKLEEKGYTVMMNEAAWKYVDPEFSIEGKNEL